MRKNTNQESQLHVHNLSHNTYKNRHIDKTHKKADKPQRNATFSGS